MVQGQHSSSGTRTGQNKDVTQERVSFLMRASPSPHSDVSESEEFNYVLQELKIQFKFGPALHKYSLKLLITLKKTPESKILRNRKSEKKHLDIIKRPTYLQLLSITAQIALSCVCTGSTQIHLALKSSRNFKANMPCVPPPSNFTSLGCDMSFRIFRWSPGDVGKFGNHWYTLLLNCGSNCPESFNTLVL